MNKRCYTARVEFDPQKRAAAKENSRLRAARSRQNKKATEGDQINVQLDGIYCTKLIPYYLH